MMMVLVMMNMIITMIMMTIIATLHYTDTSCQGFFSPGSSLPWSALPPPSLATNTFSLCFRHFYVTFFFLLYIAQSFYWFRNATDLFLKKITSQQSAPPLTFSSDDCSARKYSLSPLKQTFELNFWFVRYFGLPLSQCSHSGELQGCWERWRWPYPANGWRWSKV